MKANSTKRKIFDAVDLLTEDTSSQMPVKTMKGGVTMLDIDSIKPFHNHPFHLYEGDRLDDMVESIRDHGILNPVIVREIDDGYEMLSGHNRQKAAKIEGLKKIPAIIKYDLPDTDAYVYVIETNLMQRSFSDLEISEKAAVLKERYDKVLYQRQRESIMAEVAKLEGKPLKGGHGDHHFNNRDEVGKEYGLSGSSVGRLLKVNDLIIPLRHKLDNGSLMFKVGIQISFLTEEEQQLVYEQMMELHVKLVKQVFDVDENEDLIVALHSLYVDSWEEKSQRAFDYTTNGVLDIVSKVNDYTEEEFVNELAKVVTGFELSYWADNKINDFEEILRDTVNRLHEYNPTEGLQEGEMKITIESSDGNPIISQFSQSELSSTGQMMLNKMKSTLGNFGGSVSYEEKISIMAQMLKEIIN